MLVSAFLCVLNAPVDVQRLSLNRLVILVENLDLIRCADDHLAIVDQINLVQILQQRGDVGSQKIASVAQTCNQRSVLAESHDAVLLLIADCRKRIGTLHHLGCRIDAVLEIVFFFIQNAQQLSDDFCVCLGAEMDIILVLELFLQLHVILDNSVMNNGDTAILIDMRMRIGICRCTVCCPAGVADSRRRIELLPGDGFLQVGNFSLLLADDDFIFLQQGDSR